MSAGQGAGARPSAGDIVDALAGRAEDVCRKYLSKGRKVGGYWLVGNLANEPGSSLYVRLTAREGRAVGKFNDAATGQHGDLLDIIAAGEGSPPFPEVLDAARAFLGQTVCRGQANPRPGRQGGRARSTETIARDIHRRSHDAANTLAERYLRGRLFAGPIPYSLRYDPRCFYASGADGGPAEKWPAMIGAVTDLGGRLTGIHRTWLRRDGLGKAPVAEPKKTLGSINGHGVRFGSPGEAMFAGEGIETMLPVHMLDPDVSVVVFYHVVFCPAHIRIRYFDQSHGHCLDDEIIDRNFPRGLTVFVFWSLQVQAFTQRQQVFQRNINCHIEMRNGLFGFGQAARNSFAHTIMGNKIV